MQRTSSSWVGDRIDVSLLHDAQHATLFVSHQSPLATVLRRLVNRRQQTQIGRPRSQQVSLTELAEDGRRHDAVAHGNHQQRIRRGDARNTECLEGGERGAAGRVRRQHVDVVVAQRRGNFLVTIAHNANHRTRTELAKRVDRMSRQGHAADRLGTLGQLAKTSAATGDEYHQDRQVRAEAAARGNLARIQHLFGLQRDRFAQSLHLARVRHTWTLPG